MRLVGIKHLYPIRHSPHEVKLTPLGTSPVFQCLGAMAFIILPPNQFVINICLHPMIIIFFVKLFLHCLLYSFFLFCLFVISIFCEVNVYITWKTFLSFKLIVFTWCCLQLFLEFLFSMKSSENCKSSNNFRGIEFN